MTLFYEIFVTTLTGALFFALGWYYSKSSPTKPKQTYYWGEQGYLDLIDKILKHGVDRGDRTGTGTRAVFGEVLKFDLSKGFPLFTTKFVSLKTIAHELLWFLMGTDNIEYLKNNDVKIWDGNTSREFLDQRGLHHYKVGQLGPGYGWQWRRAGEPYPENPNATEVGVDQISEMIRLIKEDPNSRRIFMTAWNVKDLDKMALVPCHVSVQFHVENGSLHTTMYQRSADMGLGVPYNVASYALLTTMIGHICNLKPGILTIVLGDVHVYNNHIPQLSMQLTRIPKSSPHLNIKRKVEDIDDFTIFDFELVGYEHYPIIKMQMAV